MKKRTVLAASLLLVCLAGTMVAHPHFNKTVTAGVKGLELKLSYYTLPYNAKHLEGIKEGFVFHCGRAKLNIAGEITVGSTKLGAGTYLLRAKAKSADEWTLVLIPEAQAGDPQNPDVSKGIALETKSFTKQSELHHLDLNLTGGHGDTDAVGVGGLWIAKDRSRHHFAGSRLSRRRTIKCVALKNCSRRRPRPRARPRRKAEYDDENEDEESFPRSWHLTAA